jgi:Ankyrin repeats (3 copies)
MMVGKVIYSLVCKLENVRFANRFPKGQSQYLTTPIASQPIRFSISLDDDRGFDPESDLGAAFSPTVLRHNFTGGAYTEDSDDRLVRMLASQARLKDGSSVGGEDAVIKDASVSETEKKRILQDLLAMAASNGEADRLKRLLSGPAKKFVDVNAPDTDGNVPLIYASCFGHLDCVKALVSARADVDKRDNGSWCSLMWAITNRHKEIAKYLLDKGASTEIRTSSGRSPFEFIAPNSEMWEYLTDAGYKLGGSASQFESDDFYTAGFGQGRFEEEMAENEMRRRMMMESAINLEVDLGNLTIDEQSEVSSQANMTMTDSLVAN